MGTIRLKTTELDMGVWRGLINLWGSSPKQVAQCLRLDAKVVSYAALREALAWRAITPTVKDEIEACWQDWRRHYLRREWETTFERPDDILHALPEEFVHQRTEAELAQIKRQQSVEPMDEE